MGGALKPEVLVAYFATYKPNMLPGSVSVPKYPLLNVNVINGVAQEYKEQRALHKEHAFIQRFYLLLSNLQSLL